MTRGRASPVLGLAVLLGVAVLAAAAAAQDLPADDLGAGPPVRIETIEEGNVTSTQETGGDTTYRVTQRNGSHYCVRIVPPRTLDAYSTAQHYRVPCD